MNEKAELAYEDYLKGLKYKEIAEKHDVSVSTVKSWASRYWKQKGCNPKEKVATKKKKGAPIGNKNATGPPRNKHAVTTGEFESIFFDTLEEDELKLAKSITFEKMKLLEQEIQLLTVRERRMLKRIEDLKEKEMTLVSSKSGIEKGIDTDISEFEGTLGQIQNIEDALTRVQDKKQKAIDSLHKYEMDGHKLELDTMKLELEIMKQGGQDEEVEDDGFLDALKSEVGDTWDE
ncbi:phage terminase small subunit [Romboutsia maritimum]|uniref:phage terminase small subunit n=1 Tax=Romboutsia maritimum TaxID=2020948 RepID=UPI001FB190FA|nr:phage terminase small subunit [Romboutsia maritimum]